jgi:SPP1 gp7 family putative phage head morphogenesis protein
MPKTPDYLNQPFPEQLEYFRRKLAIQSETIAEIQAEYHDFAFSVSGVTRADLIEDLKGLVEKAIADGMDIEEFKHSFYRLIGSKGWSVSGGESEGVSSALTDRRIYTILDTNHRRSFAAGRIQQMRQPQVLQKRPYWQWIHRDSPQYRPHHKAIDRKVFKADEKFWETTYPPTGFGCRCTVRSLSDRDLKRLNLKVESPPDPKTFLEKGFERSAGTAPKQEMKSFLEQGISRQSPGLRRKIREDLQKKGIEID